MKINRRTLLAAAGTLPLGRISSTWPAERPLRACVIGDTNHGGYGHNLHLMWELVPGVQVVGLADPDEAGRARRGAEAGALRTYSDYREMLEKERPDLVSIAPRWTINHKEYILASAEVNAHGIIEKPLAVDLAEIDSILEIINRKNLKWVLALNYRASPVIEQVRRLIIEEGLIGDVLEIRSRGKEDRRSGGEDLIVLGVHTLDLMVTFLGSPAWCSASITVGGRSAEPKDVHEATEPLGPVVGDRLQATYGFQNGINGYFTSMKNQDGNGGRWGIEIFGSKGIVSIRMTRVPEVFLYPGSSWVPDGPESRWRRFPDLPQVASRPERMWHYSPLVEDLMSAIDEDRTPKVSLEDGRMAHEMIQAVFESHVKGGVPVEIPLTNREHPLRDWN